MQLFLGEVDFFNLEKVQCNCISHRESLGSIPISAIIDGQQCCVAVALKKKGLSPHKRSKRFTP